MAKNQKRATYKAPADEREVVVSFDRRALGVLALLVVFAAAVGIGAMGALRGATPPQAAAGRPLSPAEQGVADQNAASSALRAQMEEAAKTAADSVGENVTIIGPESVSIPEQSFDAPLPDATAENAGEVVDVLEDWANEAGVPRVPLEDLPEDRPAANWPHDVLATLGDPNVTVDAHRPYRAEDFETTSMDGGPRLAVSGLNAQFTYDFGVVAIDEVTAQDFWLKNVGDADLVIKRVYSGCGCTAPRIGTMKPDGAGWLPSPITLKPGEQVDLTVEFDPRLAKETTSQAKVIQIFSNDPTKTLFDDADPLSHETRFRIVVQPAYFVPEPTAELDG